MTTVSDYEVTESMLQLGGSFVRHLAQTFRAGDAENQALLKAAFPVLWAHYTDLAEQRAARQPPLFKLDE